MIIDYMFSPLEGDLEKWLTDLHSQRIKVPILLNKELKEYQTENPELSGDKICEMKSELLNKYYKLIDDNIEVLRNSQERIKLIKEHYKLQ